ncbi:MAG: hypothetical protein L6V95_04820 [Candidatus Melainabacteria bacterium]|nr:MAG: hypothetical protein L6V95_04820 [Candidatus Melainabacteria bacterium]
MLLKIMEVGSYLFLILILLNYQREKAFVKKMKEMKDLIPPKKICMGIAVFGVLAYCVSNFLLKKI